MQRLVGQKYPEIRIFSGLRTFVLVYGSGAMVHL